jgi:hypothetical protein
LLGSRETFLGPKLGSTSSYLGGVPDLQKLFEYYLFNTLFDHLVREIDQYARMELNKKLGQKRQKSYTRGGSKWADITTIAVRSETIVRAWSGEQGKNE